MPWPSLRIFLTVTTRPHISQLTTAAVATKNYLLSEYGSYAKESTEAGKAFRDILERIDAGNEIPIAKFRKIECITAAVREGTTIPEKKIHEIVRRLVTAQNTSLNEKTQHPDRQLAEAIARTTTANNTAQGGHSTDRKGTRIKFIYKK